MFHLSISKLLSASAPATTSNQLSNYNNYLPNASGGQIPDISGVSCGQTSRGAGGVVRNYTERGDAASIYIISIAHAPCR